MRSQHCLQICREMCGPGVAFECKEQNGLHFWEDYYIVEIVDPETLEPVPDGEIGELVLTTLNREAMPLLRYRTRDLTRVLGRSCPCGRNHVRLDRMRGRSDDMMVLRGVNIFPIQIEKILMQFKELANNYEILLRIVDVRADAHLRFAVLYQLRAEVASPRVYACLVGGRYELNGAVESAAGVPARTLLAVVEAHADFVLAFLQIRRRIHAEGVVAVRPVTSQLAVDVYVRVSHGAVKLQHGGLRQTLYVDGSLIVAATYPRQSARASRLLRLLRLAVLHDSHILQVPFLVERSVYSPVVRYCHGFVVDAVA